MLKRIVFQPLFNGKRLKSCAPSATSRNYLYLSFLVSRETYWLFPGTNVPDEFNCNWMTIKFTHQPVSISQIDLSRFIEYLMPFVPTWRQIRWRTFSPMWFKISFLPLKVDRSSLFTQNSHYCQNVIGAEHRRGGGIDLIFCPFFLENSIKSRTIWYIGDECPMYQVEFLQKYYPDDSINHQKGIIRNNKSTEPELDSKIQSEAPVDQPTNSYLQCPSCFVPCTGWKNLPGSSTSELSCGELKSNRLMKIHQWYTNDIILSRLFRFRKI